MGVPAGLEFKDAGAVVTEPAVPAPLAGPEAKGIVDAIVAVTGVVDDVNDHIVPGAFRRTLAERVPKVCLGHDWNRPIGKTLQIKELMPGDPGLPKATADGKPWPKEAGAVLARSQYNLATKDGRDAFEQAKFYLDSGQCFQSIGYRVTPEGKSFKRGVRYISDLDLFEYGPVLHPANRLAAALSAKNLDASPEVKARKYVKDSSYWGLAVGTLITPGMKPRGRTALAERRSGNTPDRNAGVTTEPVKPSADGKKPRSVAHKPEKAKEERDAAGLFPEPDAPEGARVKPSDPQGLDAEHVQDIVENEASDEPDHVARDHAFNGLIDEGITPAELEEDLHASEHWPEEMSEEDRQARIDDVVNDYRRQYRREAARQASGPEPREQHPEDDNLAVEKEEAESTAKPEPEPDAKRDITTLTPEELDKYMEVARRGSLSNVGDKQRRFQDVYAAAQAEKLRRADLERRSVPAHPLDPQAYTDATRAVEARRSRAADISKRTQESNRINAQIDDSEAAAVAAPETMKKLPAGAGQKVSKAGNGRVAFRGKGTANWAIVSADGRAIVSPAAFESEGRANVKLSGPQLDELADRIAGITNAKGDRAPFTDPESEKWVPGFRDSNGRSLEQAVSKVVADYANERGLKPGTRTRMGVESTPWGHKQGPAGVVNEEGFHPQERIQDVGPGDQVKLRNGDVKTIKNVTEDRSMQRDRYGHNVFEIEFDDGDKQKFSAGQRFDTKYSDENNPDQEGRLNDPGMGYTSASNLGTKRDTRVPGDSNVPAGTRFIYTPDRADGDNRPRVGTVTDRTMMTGGHTFQVVEYDDGTFDGVNVEKLAADGKINLKPKPEEEADARSQWGVGDAAPEEGPDGSGEPDAGGPDDTTPPEGGPDGGAEGDQPPTDEQPPAGDGTPPPTDDQAARVEQLGAADNPDRTPIAGLANQLTGQAKPDVSAISTEDLGALDQEFARRAALLGKPDGVTRAHQAVRDELATRTDTGAEPTPEPDGGLGADEAVISRAEVDDAQRTADEILGISEGPDGELEADPDVADRQDRVESLLDRAEAGALDLSAASDDEVGNERRELVEELKFQNAIARRDSRQRRIEQTEQQPEPVDQQGETGTGAEGEGGGAGDLGGEEPPPAVEKPKVRPGVAGAAEDLADALEGGDQQGSAAALVRLESSIRRSRSDSEHLAPLREALARDGGIQAAIDAGDVTPATLREFAKNLRDERRQQSNERARDRRKVKRLERERLRGLIGEYDAELRRRNLDPGKFGGTVPNPGDDESGRPELEPAPDEVTPEPDGGTTGAEPSPQEQRAQRLADEPWRLLGGVGSGETTGNPNSRAAANAAFADVATKYAPVLRDATPEQLATISAAIGAKNPDADQTEAMFIGLLLPEGPQRRAFMNDMRTAMTNYRTNLAALRARTDRGELNPEPAPELASVAPGRVGWGGRLNALAPRPRADKPAGTPPFTSVSHVTAHLKSLNPPAGASEYDQKQYGEGRDQLIREIDAAGNDVFLSPGGGLLAYRATTRDGKRWFLVHTQTGQSIPTVFNFGRTQRNLTPATGRGVEPQRYDLDGPAMRRLMTAFETMQDPRGRQVDFTESDPDRFTQSLLGWRDFSADGAVRPAFSNGEPRYTDSMEGAAILEAAREDMRRYGTTSAVHRATQMVSQDTKYSGVNGRSPQQYRALMDEQFSFALQDYNYGRKRVRGLGPSEDRTAAQLKSDKDTAATIDQARALIQTGSPAEAVAVLRARAAELKETDGDRGPRFGSPRLERLADSTADLYSPAQSDMDRLIGAQANDVIAVPTTDDEPPMIFRLTEPPTLVLTRPDGTRTYRMRVTSKDGDQDATIDTAGQYGVMIGDQYGDRYGNNQATNLGQSSIGQWSVYRAEEGQGTPTRNEDVLRDSRRTIAEFDRAAGFRNDDDEGGDTGGGGGGPEPGPDGGPDETGGERSVAAEGKAITVADAKLGDLVAIPSGDDGPPFVGHVLSKDTSGAIDGLSVVDGNGNQRVLPLDREGLIHRIDVVDDDIAGRLPDFDGEPTLTVGSIFESLPQLPEGTPVRITSGTDEEYRTVATGIVTLGPGGAYYVRTPDGRLLSTAGLVDDRGRPGRVEMVVDPKDFTEEDDKFPLSTWPAIKVEPGDKVQVYVEMEDPSAPGGVRSRWANGWVENVETMNSSLDRPITRSVLVRLPSGAAVTISGNEADQAGRSNKLRRKGKSTKATRAAVEAAGVRATRRPSAPTQLTGSVMAINAMVNSNVMMALDGSDSRIGRKGLPSERLRKLADLVRSDPVVIDKTGSASLYNGEIRTPNAIPRVFAGVPLTGASAPGELPEESNQQAAKFLQDFTLRLIDSAIATATEFEQVDQDDERVTSAVRSVFQSRRLQESATDTLAAAYRGALDKATDGPAADDVAPDEPLRRRAAQGVGRAYHALYDEAVLSLVNAGKLDNAPARIELLVRTEAKTGGHLDHLADYRDVTSGDPGAADKVREALIRQVSADVLDVQAKGNLKAEWQTIIDNRAAGTARVPTVPPKVQATVDEGLTTSSVLAKVDPAKPFTGRVAALRAQLPPAGKIGQRKGTRYGLVGDVLDGKLDFTAQDTFIPDIDPDDRGPGREAMRHLAVLRAIGNEVRAEARERVQARRESDAASQKRLAGIADAKAKAAAADAAAAAVRRKIETRIQGAIDSGELGVDSRYVSVIRAAVLADQDNLVGALKRNRNIGKAASDFAAKLRKEMGQELGPARGSNMLVQKHTYEQIQLEKEQADLERRWLVEARRDALADVRDLGVPGDIKFETGQLTTLTPEKIKNYTEWAAGHYPKEWLARGRTLTYTQLSPRGFYNSAQDRIELSSAYSGPSQRNDIGGPYGQVTIHEYGHHMEEVTPGLLHAEWMFHFARTSTGPVGRRQREEIQLVGDVQPGGGYGPNEVTMADEFKHPYSGKFYNIDGGDQAHAWELFTMGMESLFAESEHLDDDYENWMLGVLAGV
jgi:hypothetical protein